MVPIEMKLWFSNATQKSTGSPLVNLFHKKSEVKKTDLVAKQIETATSTSWLQLRVARSEKHQP